MFMILKCYIILKMLLFLSKLTLKVKLGSLIIFNNFVKVLKIHTYLFWNLLKIYSIILYTYRIVEKNSQEFRPKSLFITIL